MKKEAGKIGSGGAYVRYAITDRGAILLVLWIMFITVKYSLPVGVGSAEQGVHGVLEFGSSKFESRLRQLENFLTVTLVLDARFGMLRNSSLSYADKFGGR